MTQEHRVAPRRRIFKSGAIVFGRTSLPCAVRNLSSTAAALEVLSPLWFPDQFMLVIESEALRKACCIVWRRERRLGVHFD